LRLLRPSQEHQSKLSLILEFHRNADADRVSAADADRLSMAVRDAGIRAAHTESPLIAGAADAGASADANADETNRHSAANRCISFPFLLFDPPRRNNQRQSALTGLSPFAVMTPSRYGILM
jgi:hypothetical protein